ncbi:ComEC/Rec2 family competence protein [Clostridium sp. WILCCON 0269]|uniref:ComEC/Rec2 family competence protein n=1 Tax=Candidatus Clostridium eludens TaxID=3381663 RepID=A0ABW8SIJ1_9CLOT
MKRPLVFYSTSLAVGCMSAIAFLDSILAAAVITASFFIIFILTLETKFCALSVLFFIFGILAFNIYFYIDIKDVVEVRIVEKKNYYYIGDYNGRKLILNGKVDGLKEGQKIKAQGNFKRSPYIEQGIIGNYTLTKYENGKSDFIYYIYKFKKNIYEKFKKLIGESRAAVVMALCYGETSYMSESQMEEFQKLGVIHAISVSGFHMAIIYKTLECIFGLKLAVIISVLYVFFTGMAAATMRSFIMIFIFKLSKVFLKEYDSISSLSLAALILMVFKPYYIVNLGFGLSFLSTLGIILYNEKIYIKLFKLPEKIASNISLSFSSQIFSMPYIAFTIQNFSFGFMLGNLFLLPLFSAIVILGNAALCLYFIEPIFKFICWAINFVFIVEEGFNSIILRLCPDIIYLKYIDGLAIVAAYMSFLMYKNGYKKARYIPAICMVLILLKSCSIFTDIVFINNSSGQGIIVKKGINKVMICNYDYINTQWISDIKDSDQVEKIITNPEKSFVYDLSKHTYLKVDENLDSFMKVKIHSGNEEFNFLLSKYDKKYMPVFNKNQYIYIPKVNSQYKCSSNGYKSFLKDNVESAEYVIILNRLFRIK